MTNRIRLPIRTLCEFLLRRGSLGGQFSGLDRGLEGSRIHRMLQKRGGKNYTAEVSLNIEMTDGEFEYTLSGRADGVMDTEDGLCVDEIKTTAAPLELIAENEHPAHWAQGCCYAHILCVQRGLSVCAVRLTYYNIDTGDIKRFTRQHTAEELDAFVNGLLAQYHKWAKMSAEWAEKRNASLRALTFPFPAYREGQRGMAIACYNTFKDGGRLFCCAPTGIGKTMSSLFPAMKAVGEGHGERIFYLTAKTIARRAAEDAVALLRKNNELDFRSLTLTAKDKICFLEQRDCRPEMCEYSNGYFDRLNDALYEMLQSEAIFSREGIEAAARKYRLCPYELSLDLALWCDCIIGDYNYLFDPVVHLQRFFEGAPRFGARQASRSETAEPDAQERKPKGEARLASGGAKGGYLFLVDEAHNLVDRGRDMYTAVLRKTPFFDFKKALPKAHKRLHKALAGLNSAFVALRKRCEEAGERVLSEAEQPLDLAKAVEKFNAAAEVFLEEHRGTEWEEPLLALYFEALFYLRIAAEYDERYITLVHVRRSEVTVRLFCLDASDFLAESMDMGRASVLFSATLEPLPYYRETLGGGSPDDDEAERAKLLALESPFPQENLGLFIADGVSTKYLDREHSLAPVAHLLAAMASSRRGNYIAYFPSYSYMRQVLEVFRHCHGDIPVLEQQSGMEEAAREAFLAAFTERIRDYPPRDATPASRSLAAGSGCSLCEPPLAPQRGAPLLGFCVLGGIFAEGVDLPGDALIGSAVVGVGLPQMGPEPDAIRNYFNEKSGRGFEYAYQYPGMNKVLQAAGRVIRTERDRGVVLLIDSRFTTPRYQAMFPPHWRHWRRVTQRSVAGELAAFWQSSAEAEGLEADPPVPPPGG